MSNPNEDCHKGKKVKEFEVGQEVFTILLSNGIDDFRFNRWVVKGKLSNITTSYVLSSCDRVRHGNLLPTDYIILCSDSIFATPQEAAEELYGKIKKICRDIEQAANLGPDGTWDKFIV